MASRLFSSNLCRRFASAATTISHGTQSAGQPSKYMNWDTVGLRFPSMSSSEQRAVREKLRELQSGPWSNMRADQKKAG